MANPTTGGWFILAETDGDNFYDAYYNDLVIRTSSTAQAIRMGVGYDTNSVISVEQSLLGLKGDLDITGNVTSCNNSVNVTGVLLSNADVYAANTTISSTMRATTVTDVLDMFASNAYIVALSNTNLASSNVFAMYMNVDNFNTAVATIQDAYVHNLSNENLNSTFILGKYLSVEDSLDASNATIITAAIGNLQVVETAIIAQLDAASIQTIDTTITGKLAVANMYNSNQWSSNSFIDTANIIDMYNTNAFIINQVASNIDVDVLNASNANIAILTNEFARITEIQAGTLVLETLTGASNLITSNVTACNGEFEVVSVNNILSVQTTYATDQFVDMAAITISYLSNASVSNMDVGSATISDLSCTTATLSYMSNNSADMSLVRVHDSMEVMMGSFSNMYTVSATIEDLTANSMSVSNLSIAFVSNSNASIDFLSTFQANISNATINNLWASNAYVYTLCNALQISDVFIGSVNYLDITSNNIIDASNVYAKWQHTDYSLADFSSNITMCNDFTFINTLVNENQTTTTATIASMFVNGAHASNLNVQVASISNLYGVDVRIDRASVDDMYNSNIYAKNASVSNMYAVTSSNTYLQASNATIITLYNDQQYTSNAQISNLVNTWQTSTYAHINTLSNTEMFSSNALIVSMSNNTIRTEHIIGANATFTSITIPSGVMVTPNAAISILSNNSLSTSNITLSNNMKNWANTMVLDAQTATITTLVSHVRHSSNDSMSFSNAKGIDLIASNIRINTENVANATANIAGDLAVHPAGNPLPSKHIWAKHNDTDAFIKVGGLDQLGSMVVSVGSNDGINAGFQTQNYGLNVTMTPKGQVGINCNMPSETLVVNGTAQVYGTLASQKVSSPLAFGLVAHYVFDEFDPSRPPYNDFGQIYDHSPYARRAQALNDATKSFDTSYPSYGNNLNLTTNQSRIEITDATPPNNSMTIAFWYYYSSTNPVSGTKALACSPSSLLQAYLGINLTNGTLGYLRYLNSTTVDVMVNFTTPSGSTISLQRNKWYHIALSMNTGVPMVLYLNGTQVANGTDYGAGYSVKFIGNDFTGAQASLGKYSDVRIYNRRLFANEIAMLYNLMGTSVVLASQTGERKIVMYDAGNSSNDAQYFGFGVPSTTELAYRVPATASHTFYAGSNGSTSTKLLQMRPDGISVLTGAITDLPRKLVFSNIGDVDNQFFGFGLSNKTMIYSVANANSTNRHDFVAAGNTIMSATGQGRVGINTTTPSYELDVMGDVNFSGNLRCSGSSLLTAGAFGTTRFASNVGIMCNPTSALDVVGTARFDKVNITGDGLFNAGINVIDAYGMVQSNSIPALDATVKIKLATITGDQCNSNMYFIGDTFVDGTTTTNGHLVPFYDVEYDLGAPTARWRDLYLSGNTIYVGNTKLSTDSGSLSISDKDGNINTMNVDQIRVGRGQDSVLIASSNGFFKVYRIGPNEEYIEAPMNSSSFYDSISIVNASNSSMPVTLYAGTDSNIGINQPNPRFTLDVNGDINVEGQIMKNGETWKSSYWDFDSNTSNTGYTRGWVGVGRNNPLAPLHVNGNTILDGAIAVNNGLRFRKGITSMVFSQSNLQAGISNDLLFGINNQSNANGFKFFAASTEVARITGDGKLGVGTRSPNGIADFAGDLYVRSNVYISNGLYINNQLFKSSPWTTTTSNVSFTSGSVGIGTSTPQAELHVVGKNLVQGTLQIMSSNGSGFVTLETSNNYLGIGTSTPTSKLTVAGDVACSSLKVNGVTVVNPDGSLRTNSVTQTQILDGSVTASKLAPGAINATTIASGSVGSNQILDANITTTKLADYAVTTEKYASVSITANAMSNNSVTTFAIADNAITTSKVNPLAITTSCLSNSAVTQDKLATASVTTGALSNQAVTGSKIAITTITAANLATDAITTQKIQDTAVTSSKIGEFAVLTSHISQYAVTTYGLSNQSVTTDTIANYTITSDKYSQGSVDTNAIGNGAITATKLALQAVTTASIQDGSVTSVKIVSTGLNTAALSNQAVTAAKIALNTVQNYNFASQAVDTSALSNASITVSKFSAGCVDTIALSNLSVTASKIATGAITNTLFGTGAVDTNALSNLSISSAKLMDSAVTSSKIATGAITATAIADTTISTAKLEDGCITASKLSTNAVTNVKIQNGAVVGDKIGDGGIASFLKFGPSVVTSNAIADFTIITSKYANNSISGQKLVQGSVDTNALGLAAVTTVKVSDSNITSSKLAGNLNLVGSPTISATMFYTRANGDAALGWTNAGNTGYALAQSPLFETYINSTAGKSIHFRTGDVEGMTVAANLNVGIGTQSPQQLLHVTSSNNNDAFISVDSTLGTGNAGVKLYAGQSPATNQDTRIEFFNMGSSTSSPQWNIVNDQAKTGLNDLKIVNFSQSNVMTLLQNGNVNITGTLIQSSDSNLKKDITRIDNALEKLQQIVGYTFTHKASDERAVGLIAQEVEKIMPEAVKKVGNFLALDYSGMGAVYVEAIKELNNKLDALVSEVASIKQHIGM